MNFASLATRYRPKTFAEVTGQDTVKRILSRAVAEDKVAPAYLFSGTRGVGKTTIARIFAKALNCLHPVDGEPCNACAVCKAVNAGTFVDVIEIDGASNNKVDDARRLRETIGFAPMEGRYKVFIIDEAHMLTTQAFNALLKTLEEPPSHVTFIMATTEVHKFLPTILSRCQNFVFKSLPETDIANHLKYVLKQEGVAYEEAAVRLLSRRAAGSVRDSMSLLGQTLALGGDTLTESSTRTVLGLAGQEMYERLLTAIQSGSCATVAKITDELLSSGADIGDFLRELAVIWRNLFLLKQSGQEALPLINLPDDEKTRLATLAEKFTASAVHAAWQMTLDGQRNVLNSLEPGAALELLLLNLALTPQLVGLDLLSRTASPQKSTPPTAAAYPSRIPLEPSRPFDVQDAGPMPIPARPSQPQQSPTLPPSHGLTASDATSSEPESKPLAQIQVRTRAAGISDSPACPSAREKAGSIQQATPPQPPISSTDSPPIPEPPQAIPLVNDHAPAAPAAAETPAPSIHTWHAFLDYAEKHLKAGDEVHLFQLKQCTGYFDKNVLTLVPGSRILHDFLYEPAAAACLAHLVLGFTGHETKITIRTPDKTYKSESELKAEMANHPAIRLLETEFHAKLIRCIPSRGADPIPVKKHHDRWAQ